MNREFGNYHGRKIEHSFTKLVLVWTYFPTSVVLLWVTIYWFSKNENSEKQPPEVFCKKGALRNFGKFTGKHPCLRPAALLKKRLAQMFPGNFVKFLRTWWLLRNSEICKGNVLSWQLWHAPLSFFLSWHTIWITFLDVCARSSKFKNHIFLWWLSFN